MTQTNQNQSTTFRFKEYIRQARLSHEALKALDDIPNYHKADGEPNCANCVLFKAGNCVKYKAKVKPDYMCDSWKGEIAVSEKETVTLKNPGHASQLTHGGKSSPKPMAKNDLHALVDKVMTFPAVAKSRDYKNRLENYSSNGSGYLNDQQAKVIGEWMEMDGLKEKINTFDPAKDAKMGVGHTFGGLPIVEKLTGILSDSSGGSVSYGNYYKQMISRMESRTPELERDVRINSDSIRNREIYNSRLSKHNDYIEQLRKNVDLYYEKFPESSSNSAKSIDKNKPILSGVVATTKHLQGKHNQLSHGFRLGSSLSPKKQELYKKQGLLDKFNQSAGKHPSGSKLIQQQKEKAEIDKATQTLDRLILNEDNKSLSDGYKIQRDYVISDPNRAAIFNQGVELSGKANYALDHTQSGTVRPDILEKSRLVNAVENNSFIKTKMEEIRSTQKLTKKQEKDLVEEARYRTWKNDITIRDSQKILDRYEEIGGDNGIPFDYYNAFNYFAFDLSPRDFLSKVIGVNPDDHKDFLSQYVQRTKEVSPTPSTVMAHGTGGLFSDPALETPKKKKKQVVSKKEASLTPPESAKNAAKRALEWRDKYGNQVKAMTPVGWTRARQLASGKPLSMDTVKRMAQFNRHRKNADVNPKYKNEPWRDNGYVAWLGWGGTGGIDWAISQVNKANDKQESMKEAALATTYKHPGHINQKIHGNRYGQSANLTLDRARSLRKSGDLQKYIDKSRGLSGTKPSKQRQGEKPKVDSAEIRARRQAESDKAEIDKATSGLQTFISRHKNPEDRSLRESAKDAMSNVAGNPNVARVLNESATIAKKLYTEKNGEGADPDGSIAFESALYKTGFGKQSFMDRVNEGISSSNEKINYMKNRIAGLQSKPKLLKADRKRLEDLNRAIEDEYFVLGNYTTEKNMYNSMFGSSTTKSITTKPGGKSPGASIKNPRVYEALLKKGMPKGMAAAISNAQAKGSVAKKEIVTVTKATKPTSPMPVKPATPQTPVATTTPATQGASNPLHIAVGNSLGQFGVTSTLDAYGAGPEPHGSAWKAPVASLSAIQAALTKAGYKQSGGKFRKNTVLIDTGKDAKNLYLYITDDNGVAKRAKELLAAVSEKHAPGKHNQLSHGYRLSKTPSLDKARQYRKEGILQDYLGRARSRRGIEPKGKSEQAAVNKRLDVLKNSLKKKQDAINEATNRHIDYVKQANGQPLNDKRGGAAVLRKWESQKNRIQDMEKGIQITKDAIEREERKIRRIAEVNTGMPKSILNALKTGAITQWRKFPNTFFVKGVAEARFKYDKEKKQFSYSHFRDLVGEERALFVRTYNEIAKSAREETG